MMRRTKELQVQVASAGIDALLIGHHANRLYLSGFTGTTGWLLVTREKAYMCTDFRYTKQAQAQVQEYVVVQYQQPFAKTLRQLVAEAGIEIMGYEEEYLTVQEHRKLEAALPETRLVPTTGLVEGLRLYKDEDEVKFIARASNLDDQAFAHIIEFLQPGRTELEVALELEMFARQRGGEGPSFDSIVASGVRSALPHGVATAKALEKGDFITMDFGTVVGGYHSDFTRTVCLGKPTARQREVYEIVQQAQAAAVAGVAPGRTASEVDSLARDVIAGHGYGELFGHGVGHGVGLSIHENPRLGPKSDTILKPGMVVTIEPGIYIPDWGGVRIEDLVLVTIDGYKVFNESTKELLVIS